MTGNKTEMAGKAGLEQGWTLAAKESCRTLTWTKAGAGPHSDLLGEFPYLGPPHEGW